MPESVAPYSRLWKAPLLSARRVAFLDAVSARPGSNVSEIARVLGIHPGTAHVHARILARAGLVTTQRDGRALRLFPAGPLSPRERFLGNLGPSLDVYEAVERGIAGASSIASELGITRSSARHHLQRLARLGALRVEERRVLRTQRVYVANAERIDATRTDRARRGS